VGCPTDIGADTAHAFLADGLSERLSTKLSKIPGLSVRAYSPLSVMHGRTAREAGKELGVGADCDGEDGAIGDATPARPRRVVDATNDDLLWSDAFEASDEGPVRASGQARLRPLRGALNLSLSPGDHHRRASARHA